MYREQSKSLGVPDLRGRRPSPLDETLTCLITHVSPGGQSKSLGVSRFYGLTLCLWIKPSKSHLPVGGRTGLAALLEETDAVCDGEGCPDPLSNLNRNKTGDESWGD